MLPKTWSIFIVITEAVYGESKTRERRRRRRIILKLPAAGRGKPAERRTDMMTRYDAWDVLNDCIQKAQKVWLDWVETEYDGTLDGHGYEIDGEEIVYEIRQELRRCGDVDGISTETIYGEYRPEEEDEDRPYVGGTEGPYPLIALLEDAQERGDDVEFERLLSAEVEELVDIMQEFSYPDIAIRHIIQERKAKGWYDKEYEDDDEDDEDDE